MTQIYREMSSDWGKEAVFRDRHQRTRRKFTVRDSKAKRTRVSIDASDQKEELDLG